MITFEQYYNNIFCILSKHLITDLSNILLSYLYLKDINLNLENLYNKKVQHKKEINLEIFEFVDYIKPNIKLNHIVFKNFIYYKENDFYIFTDYKNRIWLYRILDNFLYTCNINYEDYSKNSQFKNELDMYGWINEKHSRINKFINIKNILQN